MLDKNEKTYEYKVRAVTGLIELGVTDERIMKIMKLTPETLKKIKRRIKSVFMDEFQNKE